MMPCPALEGQHPPDKSSATSPGQGGWVTHHELVATGATYRQVDYWTRIGLITAEEPPPGSGHPRRWPASEVPTVAAMVRLIRAGLKLSAAARAARNGGVIAPGVRVAMDPDPETTCVNVSALG